MTITKKRHAAPAQGMELWTVAEAKARFSELVEKAKSQGPQTITRHGKFAAVLVSAAEWQRRSTRSGTLVEFLSQSPLHGAGLKIERSSDIPRKIGL